MNKILISGEMRSGTTLLANFLNQQDKITIYRDFLHIEGLMNAIGANFLTEPLSRIQKTQLLYQFNFKDNAKLHFSLEIGDNEFDSLSDFYDLVLKKISKDGDVFVGHKTTKTYDVIVDLLNCQPDLKVIYIIRDPRDVVNSALKMFPHQTIYDHIRGWQEGSANVKKLLGNRQIKNRILLLHFEKLILNTDEWFKKIVEFLKIDSIKLPAKLTDYQDNWLNNSSIGDINEIFDEKAVNRWRNNDPRISEIVEILLSERMKGFGYDPVLEKSVLKKLFVKSTYHIYSFLNELPFKMKFLIRQIYLKIYLPIIKKVSYKVS
jgi:hypothetical protein